MITRTVPGTLALSILLAAVLVAGRRLWRLVVPRARRCRISMLAGVGPTPIVSALAAVVVV
jgi:hypothetical protein